MAKYKYPDSTPVDEPTSPEKKKATAKPVPKPAPESKRTKDVQYPDSVPVPDPITYAKGGSTGSASRRADGIATKGKTRGTMVMCGGGMAKRK